MSSYFPTMKMITKISEEVDDMYNAHCHAGSLSRPAIIDSLRKTLQSKSVFEVEQPVCVADFGTADGRASLSLIKEMIEITKQDCGQEQTIVVCFNDQPMNDFCRLSQVIQGGFEQGLRLPAYSNIYPVMIPRTMYEQCLPDNSVDLAISSVATHYLSKRICYIKQGASIAYADENEERLMKEQGKADWRAFVISRGKELKPGGFLITMNISADTKNEKPFSELYGIKHLASFVTDMARDGIITQEEYLATNLCTQEMRTDADFMEPFTSCLTEIQDLGLELVSIKPFKHFLQHQTYDIVQKDDKVKLEYSRQIVAFAYPWMYHVIYEGLSDNRTEEDKQTITDQYFSRIQKYAFDHSDFRPFLNLTEVIIKKTHRN